MSRRHRSNREDDYTTGAGDAGIDPLDAEAPAEAAGGYVDFGGPPPPAQDERAAIEAEPGPPAASEVARAQTPEAPAAPPEGESEVERLKRELAERDRQLRELADAGVAGQERASSLILPKGYRIMAHAMKRHPRGTILRADQFPPGVLERMQRANPPRVRPVFNLPADYEFPADAPARPVELPRAEDKTATPAEAEAPKGA